MSLADLKGVKLNNVVKRRQSLQPRRYLYWCGLFEFYFICSVSLSGSPPKNQSLSWPGEGFVGLRPGPEVLGVFRLPIVERGSRQCWLEP